MARQKPIEVGRTAGQRLRRPQRASRPGDRVIVSGIQKIGDGAPVRARIVRSHSPHVRRHFHSPADPRVGLLAGLILAGAVAIPTMPIAQYPELAPPQVNVTAIYTGANAQEVETAVTTPLEQAINGVEGMLYMSSSSTNSGVSTITVTFDVTRDQDLAAVDVQNRVNQALGRMPTEVRTTGITVQKQSTGFVMAVGVYAENGAVRLAVPEQLPRRLRQGRAQARARRWRRHHLRRAQLLDAAVARSRPPGGARPDGRRRRPGAARTERAGRRRQPRPGAGTSRTDVSAQRPRRGAVARAIRVRRHHPQERESAVRWSG